MAGDDSRKTTTKTMSANYRLVTSGKKREQDSWSTFAVLRVIGTPSRDDEGGDTISESEIYMIQKELELNGIYLQSAGSGVPGQPYANEPWFQWFDGYVLVIQSGGLDI